jgi:hypothetical protein
MDPAWRADWRPGARATGENSILSESDPTDHALAAIASILEHPESPREVEKADEDRPVTLAPLEADGYSKIGPGPMAAIRFKWTVRRADDDAYYVDETIGENSVPAVSGPMTGDAAIRLVDDRASEARQRYEALKSEMAGRSAAALVLLQGGGVI